MKNTASLATLRLFQLISPSLPTGGFQYSQGLETAVHNGWVCCKDDMLQWIRVCLQHTITSLDLPILQRCYQAVQMGDTEAFLYWNKTLLSHRETGELRNEDIQRGRALWVLLDPYNFEDYTAFIPPVNPSHIAGIAYAGGKWDIFLQDLLSGFVFSWMENMVTAGLKIIPLGHTQGQKILFEICTEIPHVIAQSYDINDSQIGSFTPMMAMASALHETQKSRMFRS